MATRDRTSVSVRRPSRRSTRRPKPCTCGLCPACEDREAADLWNRIAPGFGPALDAAEQGLAGPEPTSPATADPGLAVTYEATRRPTGGWQAARLQLGQEDVDLRIHRTRALAERACADDLERICEADLDRVGAFDAPFAVEDLEGPGDESDDPADVDLLWLAAQHDDAEGLTERESERFDLEHLTVSAADYHLAEMPPEWSETEVREAGHNPVWATEGGAW